jgi:hypothetical protein
MARSIENVSKNIYPFRELFGEYELYKRSIMHESEKIFELRFCSHNACWGCPRAHRTKIARLSKNSSDGVTVHFIDGSSNYVPGRVRRLHRLSNH